MKILNWNTITIVTWLLVTTPAIIQGERCFDDINCKDGEFCGQDQYNVFTICKPCLVCRDYYKRQSDKLMECVKEIRQCGYCFDGYDIAFDVEGGVLPHCVPTPRPKVDSGLTTSTNNETKNQPAGLNTNFSEERQPETSKSAGLIAGGVVLGCVALAAVIFGGVFGYKYYNDKKSLKKNEKDEQTAEIHKLDSQPV